MHIKLLLPVAEKRLVTLPEDAPVVEAAQLLGSRDTKVVVACDAAGVMTGVVSKTDIVRQISHCTGFSCRHHIAEIMTRDVIACQPADSLRNVWDTMKQRLLTQMPVIDTTSRPMGLLYASDALQYLLQEVEYEEALLRDYVMGVGYR